MALLPLFLTLIFFLSIDQSWPLGFERVELHCLSNRIEVDVVTNSDFSGTIYVQGSFRQDGCHLDAKSGKVFKLGFSLNECKTEQQNGSYRNVLIFQHEDELITKDDTAFEIQCDYKSLHKTVELKKPLHFLPTEESTEAVAQGNGIAFISEEDLQLFGNENSSIRKKKVNVISNGSNVAIFTPSQKSP